MSYFQLQNKYLNHPISLASQCLVLLIFLRLILPDPVWTPAVCIQIFFHRFSHSFEVHVHWNMPCPTSFFSFAGCHVFVMSLHTNSDWLSVIKWYVTQLSEYLSIDARAVRKESIHFDYPENGSHGLDVTWQPVRGDLTVHPWRVTLLWD